MARPRSLHVGDVVGTAGAFRVVTRVGQNGTFSSRLMSLTALKPKVVVKTTKVFMKPSKDDIRRELINLLK